MRVLFSPGLPRPMGSLTTASTLQRFTALWDLTLPNFTIQNQHKSQESPMFTWKLSSNPLLFDTIWWGHVGPMLVNTIPWAAACSVALDEFAFCTCSCSSDSLPSHSSQSSGSADRRSVLSSADLRAWSEQPLELRLKIRVIYGYSMDSYREKWDWEIANLVLVVEIDDGQGSWVKFCESETAF